MAIKKQAQTRFKDFFKKILKHEFVIYSYNFLFTVGVYGVLLSFLISIITSRYQFNLKTIIAFGLVFYFLAEEMPKIISRCRAVRAK